MEWMAKSIVIAHAISPRNWGITLFSDMVRLNVGKIEVLAYFADGVHCIIDSRNVPAVLRKRKDVELILESGGVLPSVPISGLLNADELSFVRIKSDNGFLGRHDL